MSKNQKQKSTLRGSDADSAHDPIGAVDWSVFMLEVRSEHVDSVWGGRQGPTVNHKAKLVGHYGTKNEHKDM